MERFQKIGLYDPMVVEGISGGIHVCYLSNPIHLAQASKGLCNLIGYTQEELETLFHNDYSKVIHPDDVPAFEEFVLKLSRAESSDTVFYRLVSKDGRIIPVVDTMTSRVLDDGDMWGYSVVNDLSGLSSDVLSHLFKMEQPALVEDHERAPLHGMVRVACGESPRLLSVDDGMLLILGASQEDLLHDRAATVERFEVFYSDLIEKIVASANTPQDRIGLKRRVVRRVDGTFVRIANWVSWKGSPSEKICQLFVVLEDCDISDDEKIEKDMENLEKFSHEAADVVFSYNLESGSLVCQKNSIAEFGNLPLGLPLVAEEIFKIWFASHLSEEDQKRAWALVSPSKIPFEGVIEHEVFRLKIGEDFLPASVLLLSEGSRALLLLKLLGDGGGYFTAPTGKGVHIRTFGAFEVFVDGEPVLFRSKKAKEYLALLVDRRGAFVSTKEALSVLWPDLLVSESSLARTRKAAMNMNQTLKAAGIGHIVENNGTARRLLPSEVTCDLYDYLRNPETNVAKFRGSYLPEYSWGEITLAELTFSLYR